ILAVPIHTTTLDIDPRHTSCHSLDPAPTEIYTLSLHDALPICVRNIDLTVNRIRPGFLKTYGAAIHTRNAIINFVSSGCWQINRSEEHTSELQSRENLVCRLLLEKKNISLWKTSMGE